MKNKIFILIVVFLFSCTNKRYRDNNGVYIKKDSCIKYHIITQQKFILIGKTMFPQTKFAVVCDSAVKIKYYLGK